MLLLESRSISLTPDRPMSLAGYRSRPGLYDRVDGGLEANFILLSDGRGRILIGSVDTLFLSRRTLSDLRKALGDIDTPLLLFATHTHNAPSLAPDLPRLGCHDPEWYDRFVVSCADTIKAMLNSRTAGEPLTMRYGEQRAALNISRRLPAWVLDYPLLLRKGRLVCERRIALAANKHGFVDPWLRAVFMEDDNANVRAIIWSLAAHPARYPFDTHVSPDFPGLIRDSLRARFGQDCAIIYLPGLAGSAIPNMPWSLPQTFKQACLSLLPFFPTSRSVSARVYYSWVQKVHATILVAYEHRKYPRSAPNISVDYADVPGIFQSRNAAGAIDLHLAKVSLSEELHILAFTGEMVGEWLPLLQSMTSGDALFSGYLAGSAIYVPVSSQLPEGGYEVNGFQEPFGLNGAFSPDISQRVLSAVGDLWTSPAGVEQDLKALSHVGGVERQAGTG